MSELPSVTISMISFNDRAIIRPCLQSIRDQDYPQESVFIQLFDGGSTDNTVKIAEEFGATVIQRPDLRDTPNKRSAMALVEGHTDLRLFFSADNRFGSRSTLRKMVQAQERHKSLGLVTTRYAIVKEHKALSRYFALIGGSDPLVVFLGLNDRLAYDQSDLHPYGDILYQDDVTFLLKFDGRQHLFPTLGANGFLYSARDYSQSESARRALHIDMCFEANLTSERGFIFLRDETVHHKIDTPLFDFVKRRVFFASIYSEDDHQRSYEIYNPQTRFRCMLFVLFSILVLPNLVRSIKGFINTPDLAWFLHPLVCLAYAIGYCRLYVVKKFCS